MTKATEEDDTELGKTEDTPKTEVEETPKVEVEETPKTEEEETPKLEESEAPKSSEESEPPKTEVPVTPTVESDSPVAEETEMSAPPTTIATVHQKARLESYQGAPDSMKRFQIKDEEVSWKVEVPSYKPCIYTDAKILEEKPVWADPDVE